MHQTHKNILITAEIDKALQHEIKSSGLSVDVIPFIQTNAIKNEDLQEQVQHLLKEKAVVIFTSSNAVNAVAYYVNNQKPAWQIFCVGDSTKKTAETIFGKKSIKETANNAASLAEKMIEIGTINEAVFFCNDMRRDELPKLFKKNNIGLREIEVYETEILLKSLGKNYNAILFFSPSAAKGFFHSNSVNDKTILFAIGNTTTNEIKKYTTNKIYISNKPGKKELVHLALTVLKH